MAGKGVEVEQLYKNYSILADAGESISDVSESIRCFDQYGHVWAVYNLCLHVFLFNAPHHVATHFLCIMFSYSTKKRLREYLQQQNVQMEKNNSSFS